MQALRDKVAAEIHSSERDYVASLDVLYTHWYQPMQAAAVGRSAPLKPADVTAIFSNFLGTIRQLSMTLLVDLDARVKSARACRSISISIVDAMVDLIFNWQIGRRAR